MLYDRKCNEFDYFSEKINNIRKEIGISSSYAEVTDSTAILEISNYVLVWLSTEAVAFFTPSPPFFSLLASFVSSHLDSLCTALQTRRLWIWSTGLSVQLTPSSQREVWVLGNLFVLTGRSQPAIRGMRGRGGKSYVWRLFPWRTLKISTYSVPW